MLLPPHARLLLLWAASLTVPASAAAAAVFSGDVPYFDAFVQSRDFDYSAGSNGAVSNYHMVAGTTNQIRIMTPNGTLISQETIRENNGTGGWLVRNCQTRGSQCFPLLNSVINITESSFSGAGQPRILWDPQWRRWYMSLFVIKADQRQISDGDIWVPLLAVSTSWDPTKPWRVIALNIEQNDQRWIAQSQQIGYSKDKIVLSYFLTFKKRTDVGTHMRMGISAQRNESYSGDGAESCVSITGITATCPDYLTIDALGEPVDQGVYVVHLTKALMGIWSVQGFFPQKNISQPDVMVTTGLDAQPAVDIDHISSDAFLFSSESYLGFSRPGGPLDNVAVTRIKGLPPFATLSGQNFDIEPFQNYPCLFHQPDSLATILTGPLGDARIANPAVIRKDPRTLKPKLFAVHGVGDSADCIKTGIRLYRLDISKPTKTSIDLNVELFSTQNVSYAFPSVAVTKEGVIGIGYTVADPNAGLGVGLAKVTPTGQVSCSRQPGTFYNRTEGEIFPGSGILTWGPTSSTVLSPACKPIFGGGSGFCTFQQRAKDADHWAEMVGCECTSLAKVANTTAGCDLEPIVLQGQFDLSARSVPIQRRDSATTTTATTSPRQNHMSYGTRKMANHVRTF